MDIQPCAHCEEPTEKQFGYHMKLANAPGRRAMGDLRLCHSCRIKLNDWLTFNPHCDDASEDHLANVRPTYTQYVGRIHRGSPSKGSEAAQQ